jgi:hypothetical protein
MKFRHAPVDLGDNEVLHLRLKPIGTRRRLRKDRNQGKSPSSETYLVGKEMCRLANAVASLSAATV